MKKKFYTIEEVNRQILEMIVGLSYMKMYMILQNL